MPVPLPLLFAAPEVPLVLVPARINGRGPYHLLIDTGNGEAEPILFRPVASALGLAAGPEREEPGVLGPVRLGRARLDLLEVGDLRLQGLETILMDELQLPPVTLRPDGILGSGVFRSFRLVIDYPGRNVAFAASSPGEAAGAAIALGSPKPYVIVECRVNHGPPRSFLLDTGASSTTLSPDLAAELGLSLQPVDAVAVGGAAQAGMGRVSRLEVAGMVEVDAEVAVIDLFQPVSRAAGRKIEGVLGYPFFKHCRVEIDYPARRLTLTPREPTPR